jgi:hypothetical protein
MLRHPQVYIGTSLTVIELGAELRARSSQVVFYETDGSIQVLQDTPARKVKNRGQREFLKHLYRQDLVLEGHADAVEQTEIADSPLKLIDLCPVELCRDLTRKQF